MVPGANCLKYCPDINIWFAELFTVISIKFLKCTGIRQGTELCALGTHQKSMHEFIKNTKGGKELTKALSERDAKFGDYRTSHDGNE